MRHLIDHLIARRSLTGNIGSVHFGCLLLWRWYSVRATTSHTVLLFLLASSGCALTMLKMPTKL